VKPPPFAFARVTTVQDALGLLTAHGDDAKLLAGGQSLIPLLNFRMARPTVVADINALGELNFIRSRTGPEPVIEIGALTRQCDIERSTLVRRTCPILATAAGHIGHVQIRNRGTVGGSLAHADPAAELPLVFVTLDGEIVARSQRGGRTIAAERFFTGLWETDLRPDEIIEYVRLQGIPPGAGWAFGEVCHRAGDFAVVAVAVVLLANRAGRVAWCRVGLTGAGTGPRRLREVEDALSGAVPGPEVLRDVARLAKRIDDFQSDLRGSQEYRKDVAVHLLEAELTEAVTMTGVGHG
jgi:aerobic carbon-monoxide dehydrogenase medium subunit